MGDSNRSKVLSPNAPHAVEFFRRHGDDDHERDAPGWRKLGAFPDRVRRRCLAVLVAVAEAPPSRFSGGGMWERMHGDLAGLFEVRVNSGGQSGVVHYRVFCVLDYSAVGADRPLLVVIDAATKKRGSVLSASDYAAVRALRDEYFGRNPRSFVE